MLASGTNAPDAFLYLKLFCLARARRRAGRRRRGAGAIAADVHQIFQFLARLKERDLLGGDFHAVAGLRIASHARLALPRAEAAETTDLDLVSCAQRAHDAVKNRLDDDFAVFAGQFRQAGDLVDEIGFGHGCGSTFRRKYKCP